MHTNYLIELSNNLRWIEVNRKPLSEAARAGDLMAGVIISRVRDVAAGDYRRSAIEALNLECETYRKGQGHA